MENEWKLEFGDDILDPEARNIARITAFSNGCPLVRSIFMDEHGWKVSYTDNKDIYYEKKLYNYNVGKVPYFIHQGKRKNLHDCLFPPVNRYQD